MKASAGGHVNITQLIIAHRAILDLKNKVYTRTCIHVRVYTACTCIHVHAVYMRQKHRNIIQHSEQITRQHATMCVAK